MDTTVQPARFNKDGQPAQPGEPYFEIHEDDSPPAKGLYFLIFDSNGNQVGSESNKYAYPDPEGFCQDGGERALRDLINQGKVS